MDRIKDRMYVALKEASKTVATLVIGSTILGASLLNLMQERSSSLNTYDIQGVVSGIAVCERPGDDQVYVKLPDSDRYIPMNTYLKNNVKFADRDSVRSEIERLVEQYQN